MLSRVAVLALAVAALAACGDGGGSGPEDLAYDLGIVSGNHQVAQAGSAQLSAPVVGKLVSVRLADGTSRLQFVRPLYAQTTVNGSPVPGAVVCAAKLTEGAPEPFTVCTSTKNDGTATFHFSPGTKAGDHLNEIRGVVNDQPAAFDTVFTTVVPGPVAGGEYSGDCLGGSSQTDTLDLSALRAGPIYAFEDQYGNPIPWAFAAFPTSTLYSVRSDSLSLIAAPSGSGIDSVQIFVDGAFYRTGHVYVRHPGVPSYQILLWLWTDNHDCGDVTIPAP